MTQSKFLIRTSGALALVALLSACGGSDDGSNGGGGDGTKAPPLETAVDAQTTAEAALKAAQDQLETATDASVQITAGASNVNGDSQAAQKNATAVLAAVALVQAEYDKANKAVTDAEAALAAADDADKARIRTIITSVKEDRDAIKTIQDAKGAGSLDAAVKLVQATTGVTDDDTDAEVAQKVADAVGAAMHTNIGTLVTSLGSSIASSGAPDGAVMNSPNSGMTFKQIFGADNKVATKLEGYKGAAGSADDITDSAFNDASNGAASRGDSIAAHYMGIAGALFCFSAECSASDGEITGDVQFFPSDADQIYTRADADSDYAVLYARATYGHWLTSAGLVQLHADTLSTSANSSLPNFTRGDSSVTEDVTATYNGKAGGYSARNTGTTTDAKYASGTFTADVTLNATFMANAGNSTLKGTISGFAGGAHVNPEWYVTLPTLTGGSNLNGVTVSEDISQVAGHPDLAGKEDATAGSWTAAAYGAAGKNPTGFVGRFAVGFADGRAAGTYFADKD